MTVFQQLDIDHAADTLFIDDRPQIAEYTLLDHSGEIIVHRHIRAYTVLNDQPALLKGFFLCQSFDGCQGITERPGDFIIKGPACTDIAVFKMIGQCARQTVLLGVGIDGYILYLIVVVRPAVAPGFFVGMHRVFRVLPQCVGTAERTEHSTAVRTLHKGCSEGNVPVLPGIIRCSGCHKRHKVQCTEHCQRSNGSFQDPAHRYRSSMSMIILTLRA